MSKLSPFRIHYDQATLPVAKYIRSALGVADFTALHDERPLVTIDTDQVTEWHEKFYRYFGAIDKAIYRPLVRRCAATLRLNDFYYQTVPTFRVSVPGNQAVGEWHRDTDYGHQEEEINFWVTLTPAFQSNTIWIENDSTQPISYSLLPGEILVFPGSLTHGNKINETDKSRVSFDFRIIAKDKLNNENRSAHGVRFAVGEYWTPMEALNV